MEMDTVQIKGVDSTNRVTKADLADDATLIIKEKIMTHGRQYAKTDFVVDLNGEGCGADVMSRSVARDDSKQEFVSRINGNNKCNGHTECDAILMDHGCVTAVPELTANHLEASLIHEAAIGKIAGEQIIKLIEEEQLYKRKGLRISDVATELATNKTYVSAMINNISGFNFPDLINGYRIRDAQALMQAHPEMPLADVAEECGFSSLTTLRRCFKAQTGKTPQEWRNSIKK